MTAPSQSGCDRFAREGALRLEQGLPLDRHFEECPACRRARADYEALGRELAALDADLEPPADWSVRVWQRIDARRARRGRRWLPWLVPAAVAVAAAALLAIRLGPTATGVDLTVAIEPGPGVRRGVEAQPGDLLTLRARTGNADHAELRLYRDERELVLRCADRPPCQRDDGELRATVALAAIGSYQPLLLLSDDPLPDPGVSGLDGDAAAALAAGARVELAEAIRVR